jgi:hypothetical protein
VTEAELEGVWVIDPIQESRLIAFRRHYRKHRLNVEAEDEAQYLRKAIEFSRNLRGRGSPVPGLTPGVRRWQKQGRYIDMTPDNEIVSFGATE